MGQTVMVYLEEGGGGSPVHNFVPEVKRVGHVVKSSGLVIFCDAEVSVLQTYGRGNDGELRGDAVLSRDLVTDLLCWPCLHSSALPAAQAYSLGGV